MRRRFFSVLILVMTISLLMSCGSRVTKPENLYADASTGNRMTFQRVAYTTGDTGQGFAFYGIKKPEVPVTEPVTNGYSFRIRVYRKNDALPPDWMETSYIVDEVECDFLRAVFSEQTYRVQEDLREETNANGYNNANSMLSVTEYKDGEKTKSYDLFPTGRITDDYDASRYSASVLSEKDIATVFAMAAKYQDYAYTMSIPKDPTPATTLTLSRGDDSRTVTCTAEDACKIREAIFGTQDEIRMKTVIGTAFTIPEGSIRLTEKQENTVDIVTYLAPDGHLYREYTAAYCNYLPANCHVARKYEAGYAVSEETYDYAWALGYLTGDGK